MNHRRRILLMATAVATAAGLLATGHAASAVTSQATSPTDRLQVWNLNTNGMHTGANGGTNYRQFLAYITDPAKVAYLPDLLTIQEAGSPDSDASCQQFSSDLELIEHVDYNCYESGQTGGAAVVYRTGRLSYHAQRSVPLDKVVQSGADAGQCKPSDWAAMVIRLSDDLNANHDINVASVHLPVQDYPDPPQPGVNPTDCAWDNMKLLSPVVDGTQGINGLAALGSASMKIMAGDFNHPDATRDPNTGQFQFWECWYNGTNVDRSLCGTQNLGWKDMAYRACQSASDVYACTRTNHWTRNPDWPQPVNMATSNRIDFLFAKAYAIYNPTTVDWADAYAAAGSPAGAQARYSSHRGQGALLRYY